MHTRLSVPAFLGTFAFLLACGSAPEEAQQARAGVTPSAGTTDGAADVANGSTPAAASDALSSTAVIAATVHKDPNCGCCADWVTHIEAAGFRAAVNDTRNMDAVKRRLSVPPRLHSCHTAEIGGYVIEGHVPADLIRKLLTERPQVAGLAVPGMPMGSPGMEGPYSEPYEVLAFQKSGATSVYARR